MFNSLVIGHKCRANISNYAIGSGLMSRIMLPQHDAAHFDPKQKLLASVNWFKTCWLIQVLGWSTAPLCLQLLFNINFHIVTNLVAPQYK